MTWAAPLFATARAGTESGVTTVAGDTTGCGFLIASVAWFPGITANGTMSDSRGNTWVALNAIGTGTGTTHRQFVCFAPSVGTGHTFSYNGTSIFPGMQVLGFAGTAVSPVNQQNQNTGTGVSTLTTGSVTPSVAGCLLVASVAHGDNAGGARSINSGFTIPSGATSNFVSGAAYGGSIAYLIQTTAAAANPTWEITNGATDVRAAIAAFQFQGPTGSSIAAISSYHRMIGAA